MYLPVFAALALAGCAHSGYRTSYLEEYAGYDCNELQAERLVVEDELGPKWVRVRSAGNTMNTALFFSDTVPPVPAAVAARMTPTIFDYPYATGNQKERMQMHAKWQALLELERNRGCAQAS